MQQQYPPLKFVITPLVQTIKSFPLTMVLNLITYPLTASEVANPNPMVYTHVAFKALQAGLLLGSIGGISVNLFKIYYQKSEKVFNWDRVGRYARNGVIPAVLFFNAVCYKMLNSSLLEKNQSRAFRIQKNYGQNRVDDLTFGGILGGLIYGAFQPKNSIGQLLISASFGGIVGLLIDFGIVAAVESMKNKH